VSATCLGDAAVEVAAELSELADLLEALDDDTWELPSLCEGWRVRDVVAHVTMPTRWSGPRLALPMLRHRFRWNDLADHLARRDAQALTTTELLAALRSRRLREWRPPGGGAQGALVHAVVHGIDVTAPLGIDRELPAGRMRLVLAGLTSPRSLSHFGVDLDGIELHADDVSWSHGSGRAVHLDARQAALVLSGRRRVEDSSDAAG